MAVTAKLVKELREITSAGMMDCKKALVETDGNIEEAVKLLREKGLLKAAKKAGRIAAEGITAFAIADDNKKGVILEVNSETDFVAKNENFIEFVDQLAAMLLAGDYANVDALKAANFADSNDTVETTLNNLIAKIGENMSIRRFDYLKSDGLINGYVHANGKMSVLVSFDTDADKADIEAVTKDVAMQVAAMSPKFVDPDAVDQDYLASEKEILLEQAKNENESSNKPKPMNIVEKMVEGRMKKMLKEICLTEQVFVKDGDLTVGALVEQKAKALGKTLKVKSFVRYEVGEGIEKKEEDFASEVAATMRG